MSVRMPVHRRQVLKKVYVIILTSLCFPPLLALLINKRLQLSKLHRGYYFNLYAAKDVVSRVPSTSKLLETAIKVKRLKQIMSEDGDYKQYLEEKRRYAKAPDPIHNGLHRETEAVLSASDDNSLSNIRMDIDTMGKVVAYKQELQRKNATMNSVPVGNLENIVSELEEKRRYIKIAFLPDCGWDNRPRSFYAPLISSFNETTRDDHEVLLEMLPMPDVHEFNTKRFETKWMDYMRAFNLSAYELVVGHGTSGEALLRYMESEPVRSCILIDATDLYTAGERHGRAFRFSRILTNCPQSHHTIVYTTPKGRDDSVVLINELKAVGINGLSDVDEVQGNEENENRDQRLCDIVKSAIIDSISARNYVS